MARVAPWTDLEGHLGLWTGCFPALQPLMRLISYKLGLRSTISATKPNSNSGYRSGTAGSKHSPWAVRRTHGGYVNFSADKDDSRSSGGILTSSSVVGGKNASNDEMRDLELCDLKVQPPVPAARNQIFKRMDVRVQIGAAPQVPEKD